MARSLPTGKAQSVSPQDFNERVKRLLADKPDPQKLSLEPRISRAATPFRKG